MEYLIIKNYFVLQSHYWYSFLLYFIMCYDFRFINSILKYLKFVKTDYLDFKKLLILQIIQNFEFKDFI
jgi:hypothetical protein